MISLLLSLSLFVLIIPIAIFVIMVVGLYKLFEKSGVEGWKAIIPFYNIYVLSTEICKLNAFWGLAYALGEFIPIVGALVSIIASVNVNYAIAKKFKQDEVGIVLTCLFAPIMYCVFGFGGTEYSDVDIPEHGLFQGIFSSDSSTSSGSTSSKKKADSFCTHCGSPLAKGDKFCQSCGSEIK